MEIYVSVVPKDLPSGCLLIDADDIELGVGELRGRKDVEDSVQLQYFNSFRTLSIKFELALGSTERPSMDVRSESSGEGNSGPATSAPEEVQNNFPHLHRQIFSTK
jgi:hypothetical protein